MYGRAPRVLGSNGGGSTTSKIGPGYYSPQEPKNRAGVCYFRLYNSVTVDVQLVLHHFPRWQQERHS